MKAALYPNFQKKNALQCAREVCDVLHEADIEVSLSPLFRGDFSDKDFIRFEEVPSPESPADVVIAIGGDGTILRCAKHLIGTDMKLLGINTGTLGFMAGLEADQLDKLRLLRTGEYALSRRMTVDISFRDSNGVCSTYTALNEVAARSGSFRICDFEVYADSYLVGRYRADGVLFSTPSGSTAYALSAGGPIIEPDLECIEMTLICPHSLFSRATLFSPERSLMLTDRTAGEDSLVISIDGEVCKHLGEGESIEIHRGRHDLQFVDLVGNAFHDSLCRKMCKPLK